MKESVFPFAKFPGVDVILGPEMRSTGEVMGIDYSFSLAYAKSQIAAGHGAADKGDGFHFRSRWRQGSDRSPSRRLLADEGFEIVATAGTHAVLARNDVASTRISKLNEGRPNIKDLIKNGQVQLIINTPTRKGPQTDEGKIRALAVLNRVPIVTTIDRGQRRRARDRSYEERRVGRSTAAGLLQVMSAVAPLVRKENAGSDERSNGLPNQLFKTCNSSRI